MKAIYCNMCKKLFPENETYEVELDIGYTENYKGDVCNDCRDKIESLWLTGKNEQ